MDWQLGLSISLLVYLAFGFGFFGFLSRDELVLRLMLLAANTLYLVYYYHVAAAPMWDPIIINAFLAGANLWVIAIVLLERTTFAMSPEMATLYRQFPLLSPGQFRRLMKAARIRDLDEAAELTREGAPVERIWFVHEGRLRIVKAGSEVVIPGGIFVGELAFLSGAPASATVRTEPGVRCVEWEFEALRGLMRKSPKLNVALRAQFNADLVRKVTNSMPLSS